MYYQNMNGKENHKCVGDFGLIAFYYLLRVGEYTYHNKKERRRTKQFRLQDVTLWENTNILDPDLPLETLYKRCTAATLNIANQKNGVRAQTIHQEAINIVCCPVRAIIRRIKHIRKHTTNPETMLGSYFEPGKTIKSITTYLVTKAIKNAAKELELHKQGLTPKHISSHSLRAGGAMALHIAGVPDTTIKKLGRWSSDIFLMYIHEQIAIFSKGISSKMAQHVQFHNIAFRPVTTVPELHSPMA